MNNVDVSIIAGIILLGMWLCLAAPVGILAHRRLRRIEKELGAPALPPHELSLLLTAVAVIAWPMAAVVAVVASVRRPWARLGRNASLVFLLQITGCVLGAIGVGIWNAANPPRSTADELFPIVVMACANLAAGILMAMPLLWLWAGRRAERLRLAPPRGEAPGLWRFAVYAASLFFWPLGVLLAVIFNAPENARVGANAFRCSLVQLVGIALAVCAALPLVVKALISP